MVEVQVREQDVRDVFGCKARFADGFQQCGVAVRLVVAEKFLTLLVAHARVDQDQAIAVLDQQAAHSPGAEVVGVGGVVFLPKHFRDDAEHGPAIEFEKSGVDYV